MSLKFSSDQSFGQTITPLISLSLVCTTGYVAGKIAAGPTFKSKLLGTGVFVVGSITGLGFSFFGR
jgi:hypothetical protein